MGVPYLEEDYLYSIEHAEHQDIMLMLDEDNIRDALGDPQMDDNNYWENNENKTQEIE